MRHAFVCLIAVLTIADIVRADPIDRDPILEFTYLEEGFKPLFNGRDMQFWTMYLGDDKADPTKTWSVKDNLIICTGKPAGYIVTKEEFANYVLKLQWRWAPGSEGGNSGVLLHVQPPNKVWPKSVEAQLQHGQAGDFWLIDAKLDIDDARRDPNVSRHFLRLGEKWEKTGSKDKKGRDEVKAVRKSFEKPIGEWNQYEIHCNGNNIKLMINGQLVNEGKNGELSKGKIALQSEGAEVHFRNIEIKVK